MTPAGDSGGILVRKLIMVSSSDRGIDLLMILILYSLLFD